MYGRTPHYTHNCPTSESGSLPCRHIGTVTIKIFRAADHQELCEKLFKAQVHASRHIEELVTELGTPQETNDPDSPEGATTELKSWAGFRQGLPDLHFSSHVPIVSSTPSPHWKL